MSSQQELGWASAPEGKGLSCVSGWDPIPNHPEPQILRGMLSKGMRWGDQGMPGLKCRFPKALGGGFSH